MSNFRPINRDMDFLMPPSVDEWLPQRHLARFVAEVIEGLDLRAMTGSYRGSGEASYHPRLLLGLIIYGYATGVFSSRELERATHASVAFRYVATLLHGSRERRSSPLSFRFLHDADGFWASKLQHPVQDADSNDNLGGLPAVRVRSQRVADHPLVAADVRLH
jgi:hypothetical protein